MICNILLIANVFSIPHLYVGKNWIWWKYKFCRQNYTAVNSSLLNKWLLEWWKIKAVSRNLYKVLTHALAGLIVNWQILSKYFKVKSMLLKVFYIWKIVVFRKKLKCFCTTSSITYGKKLIGGVKNRFFLGLQQFPIQSLRKKKGWRVPLPRFQCPWEWKFNFHTFKAWNRIISHSGFQFRTFAYLIVAQHVHSSSILRSL